VPGDVSRLLLNENVDPNARVLSDTNHSRKLRTISEIIPV